MSGDRLTRNDLKSGACDIAGSQTQDAGGNDPTDACGVESSALATGSCEPGLRRASRRAFLAASPLLALAGSGARASAWAPQVGQSKPVLPAELSAAEQEVVAQSKMAADLLNFFGKGHSCAESGLAVALRFLKQPDQPEWIAAGFGGGIQHGDLCGFLTSGVMALGLHAGTTKLPVADAKSACSQRVREFWQWWTEVAPLHCSEIRAGRADARVCQRLGRLAAAKIEELITRAT